MLKRKKERERERNANGEEEKIPQYQFTEQVDRKHDVEYSGTETTWQSGRRRRKEKKVNPPDLIEQHVVDGQLFQSRQPRRQSIDFLSSHVIDGWREGVGA